MLMGTVPIRQGVKVLWLAIAMVLCMPLLSSAASSHWNDTTAAPTGLLHETPTPPRASLTWQGIVTATCCVVLLLVLCFDVVSCSLAMFGLSVFLCISGVIDTSQALEGLMNPSVVTVQLLVVLTAPVAQLPLAKTLLCWILHTPTGGKSTRWLVTMVTFKVSVISMLLSGFIGNIPVTVMLTAMLQPFCNENKLPLPQVLMSVNVAGLVGGTFSKIGVSTTMLINGLMEARGLGPLSFFETSKVSGLPAIVALVYVTFAPHYLLPRTPKDPPTPSPAESPLSASLVTIEDRPSIPPSESVSVSSSAPQDERLYTDEEATRPRESVSAESKVTVYVNVPMWFPFGSVQSDAIDTSNQAPIVVEDGGNAGPLLLQELSPPRIRRKVVALPPWYQYLTLLAIGIPIGCSIGGYPLVVCCQVAVLALIGLRLRRVDEVIKSLKLDVFLVMAFSFGLGTAMSTSGLSLYMAHKIDDAHVGGWTLKFIVSLTASAMSNVISSKAAVQVLLPVVIDICIARGEHPLPSILVLAVSIVQALITAYAHASGLIVQSAAGYTALDFFRVGAPLNIVLCVLVATTAQVFYPGAPPPPI